MKTPMYARFAICTFMLGLAGCSTGRQVAVMTPETSATIARVGPYAVSAVDLAQAVTAIFGAEAKPALLDSADLRVALDALIGARVLVLEAERSGLDKDPGIVARLDSVRAVKLREAIYEHVVYADLPAASPQDVASLYAEWGSGEQVRAGHILLRSAEEAGQVLQLLAEGADFTGLARERSQHTESSTQGGDMGYLRRSQYPEAIANAIWAMPVGHYTRAPVRSFMGWHVVRVLDRRRLTVADQQIALEAEFARRQRQQAAARFVESLRQSYAVIYYPETAEAVASLSDTLSGQRQLFTWRDGSLDLAGFLQRVQVPDPVSEDTARMHRLAEGLVFDELAAREAAVQGLEAMPEVRRVIQAKRFQWLGEAMFAAATTPEPGTDELLAFFAEHQEGFRAHTVVTVREILVDSPVLADSLYQQAMAGQSMEELARRHTVRSDLRKTDGFWPDVRPGDPRSGRIYEAALRHGPGLHPPLRVNGGYSVFEVLDVHPGKSLTFAEAEPSVRRSLDDFRMESLMGRLRQEFSGQISIDHGGLRRPVEDRQ